MLNEQALNVQREPRKLSHRFTDEEIAYVVAYASPDPSAET